MKNRNLGFAKRFSGSLSASGKTKAALAHDLKISYEMVRRYCSGDAVPAQDRAAEVAAALGVSTGWLLYGEEKQAPQQKEVVMAQPSHNETAPFRWMIRDDSMSDGCEKALFAPGNVAIVSPGLSPQAGDVVLVKCDCGVEFPALRRAVVRYKAHGTHVNLEFHADNLAHATVGEGDGAAIVGVVTEVIVKLRTRHL